MINESFINFTNKMRIVFIEKLNELENVENPHEVFSYFHLSEGLKKHNEKLYNLLSTIHNPTILISSKEDFELIKKQCIHISNYSKFIYDKADLMIKELKDK